MFLKFKFSILDAYKTSLRVNYKNIFFYLSWYGIITIIGFFALFGFGIYSDILNIPNLTQNYTWVVSSLKHQLIYFFIGIKYLDIKFTGFTFYDLLKLFASEDVLNHTLQSMSFKEYFNVIVLPKKIVLVPILMIWLSFLMAVSIGYIKTALKFQSGKNATLHDMYQYVYLLPQYLFGKIIINLVCSTSLMVPIFLGFLVMYAKTPGQNSQLDKFGLVVLILFLLGIIFASFLYQRLRFMKYFIIDKEVSAFKAVWLSWDVTRGSVISLSLFSSVAVLVAAAHPISGLFMMLSGWLNQQAEVSLYRQMIESENR